MIDLIKQKIRNSDNNMISYAQFMDLALYHPSEGYYMKEQPKIGKEGDFYTTSNHSDVYGALMANWFYKLITYHQIPANICEIGAGTGRFAKAFIEEWKQITDKPLQYSIVEKSPFHRKLQQESLSFFSIQQVESLAELESFAGIIFSNELFDSLPVHVIKKKEDTLYEIMITTSNGELKEVEIPLKNKKIETFLKENHFTLNEGQRIEIPLAMEKMIAEISSSLKTGFVVTFDYGYTDKEWREPIRRDGSLRGYWKHQQENNVLLRPGEMDITSHVHFDSFIRYGEKHGLKFYKKLRQDQFFMAIGILDYLTEHHDSDPFSNASKRNRAIKSLILPGGISSSFHGIIQGKGLPDEPNLYMNEIIG